jgi:predicted Rossmann-fold nucleotide-binding protein
VVGDDYWQPLREFLSGQMLDTGTIDQNDLEQFHFTNSAEAVIAYVKEAAIRRFGLTYGPRTRKRWYLGEW